MNDLTPPDKVSRRPAVNKPAGKITPSRKSQETSPDESVDRVSLSSTSRVKASQKAPAGEIRRDLVNKFRRILAQGDYDVKANEIADKIVQKIRENKNQVIL